MRTWFPIGNCCSVCCWPAGLSRWHHAGTQPSQTSKLGVEVAEGPADLDECELDRRCLPVIVVAGGPGLPHNQGKHVAAK